MACLMVIVKVFMMPREHTSELQDIKQGSFVGEENLYPRLTAFNNARRHIHHTDRIPSCGQKWSDVDK